MLHGYHVGHISPFLRQLFYISIILLSVVRPLRLHEMSIRSCVFSVRAIIRGLPQFNNPPSCALLTRPRVPRHFFHYRLAGRKFIRTPYFLRPDSHGSVTTTYPEYEWCTYIQSAPPYVDGRKKGLELIFLSAVAHISLPRISHPSFSKADSRGNCEKNLNSVSRSRSTVG